MMGGDHVALQLFSFWDAERKSYHLQKIEEVPSEAEPSEAGEVAQKKIPLSNTETPFSD